MQITQEQLNEILDLLDNIYNNVWDDLSDDNQDKINNIYKLLDKIEKDNQYPIELAELGNCEFGDKKL